MASFKEDLFQLSELSVLESKISELDLLLERLPQQLQALDRQRDALQQELQEKKNLLEHSEKQYHLTELERKDFEEKLAHKEAKLREIKTNKEFQAITKEISLGKKENSERELRVLQLAEQLEKLKDEIPALAEKFESVQSQTAEEKSKIEAEIAQIAHQKAEQARKRSEILSTLNKTLVSKYERVLIRRRPGIAPIRQGTCQECNIHIPPQLFIQIQKYLEVIHCPSCQRILYVPLEPSSS